MWLLTHILPILIRSRKCDSKTVWSGHLEIDQTKALTENGSFMKVESIAECAPWSILKYFWPALSDNWS